MEPSEKFLTRAVRSIARLSYSRYPAINRALPGRAGICTASTIFC